MAKLESLVVDLAVNSAALRAGLDSAKKELGGFGSSVAAVGKTLSGISQMQGFQLGKDLVKGLGEFVLKGAEAADKMGKLAQVAGTSVETFSRLDYAAGLSGVSTEELSSAFTRLNVNLSKAGAGSRDQVVLFESLGVAVKDSSGKVRDSAVVMSDLAAKFAGFSDGASKSALAVEIFGKSGADLIPFLNEGATGLAKLGDEADRFGITITGAASAAAQQFNDNLEKISRAAAGVSARVAGELSPALSNLTERLLNSREGADALNGAVAVLATGIKLLVSAGVVVGAVFDAVGTSIARTASTLTEVAKGNFGALLDYSDQMNADMVGTAVATVGQLKAIWGDPVVDEALKKQDSAMKRSADATVASIDKKKKAAEEFAAAMKTLTKVAEDAEKQVGSFDAGPIEAMANRLESGDLSEELRKIGDAADEMKERILAAVGALEDLKLGRLQLQADFKLAAVNVEVSANVQSRKDGAEVGSGAYAQNKAAQKGFDSFSQALDVYAKQTEQAARDQETANLLRASGDERGALEAQRAADAHQRVADSASSAADAFERESQGFVSAVAAAAQTLLSKMGDVGQIIGAGVQGFMSGGPWGAIIAVIAEILSRLEGFTKISESLNAKLFKSLGELNTALAPIWELFAQLSGMLNPVRQIIHSVITFVLQVLKPIFESTGAIFEGIGEILAPIADALSAVFDAILTVVGVLSELSMVTETTSFVFKVIGVAIGFAMAGIMTSALGIIRLVQEVQKAFGANYSGTKKTGDDIEDKIKSMQKGWGEGWEKYDPTVKPHEDGAVPLDDRGMTPVGKDAADAIEKLGTAAEKTADKFGELLTNLPSGYKRLKGIQFGADDGGSPSGPVGPVGPVGPAPAGASATGPSGFDFSGAGGFDQGKPLGDVDYTQAFDQYGGLTGAGSTDLGGDGGTAVPGNGGAGWTPAQMAAFVAAYAAAIDAGATEEQAAQAGTMAANGIGGGGSSSGALSSESTRPGGDAAPAGGGAGVYFYGPVTLMPRNMNDFVSEMTALQEDQQGQRRRNPYKAK